MNYDISYLLDGWPYEPGQITVRRINGRDGREKIQLRLDLGILQMETAGRPDGLRPEGHESYLAYQEHLLDDHRRKHGSDKGFRLDERACELLRVEATMYYHRYLAEFVLEDFAAVDRDTARNLRLFNLCAAYAVEESDKHELEQYRPYLLMMNSRAKAHIALADSRPKAALSALKKGIDEIRDFFRRTGQDESASASGELAVLRAMGRDIEARLPVDPVRRIRRELASAVRDERYEDAAALRDKLRKLTEPHKPEPQNERQDDSQGAR